MDTPTTLQTLPNGTIHWERPLVRQAMGSRAKEYTCVERECSVCGVRWYTRIHEARKVVSGGCRSCTSRIGRATNNKPMKGLASPHYSGPRRLTDKGYVDIKLVPGDPWYDHAPAGQAKKSTGSVRYMAEHRWVMANVLGRPLERWEQVHHIDSDKQNNDPSNLILVEHRVHNAITALERENFRLRAEVNRLRECLASLQHQSAA